MLCKSISVAYPRPWPSVAKPARTPPPKRASRSLLSIIHLRRPIPSPRPSSKPPIRPAHPSPRGAALFTSRSFLWHDFPISTLWKAAQEMLEKRAALTCGFRKRPTCRSVESVHWMWKSGNRAAKSSQGPRIVARSPEPRATESPDPVRRRLLPDEPWPRCGWPCRAGSPHPHPTRRGRGRPRGPHPACRPA